MKKYKQKLSPAGEGYLTPSAKRKRERDIGHFRFFSFVSYLSAEGV